MKKDKYPYSLLIFRIIDITPYLCLFFLGALSYILDSFDFGKLGVGMILITILGEWRQRSYANDPLEESILSDNFKATGLNSSAKVRVFLVNLNPLIGALGAVFTGLSFFTQTST